MVNLEPHQATWTVLKWRNWCENAVKRWIWAEKQKNHLVKRPISHIKTIKTMTSGTQNESLGEQQLKIINKKHTRQCLPENLYLFYKFHISKKKIKKICNNVTL